MKTQRRQDLKTNELSVYLRQVGEYFNQHAATIIVSAVLLVVVVAAVVYANHTTVQNRERGWQAYREAFRASFTPDTETPNWAEDVIARWEAVIVDYSDEEVESQAAWQLAEFCLRRFIESDDDQLKTELLDKAEHHCRLILDRSQTKTTLRAAALNGLSVVQQNRYVLDGHSSHKEQAREYLERIRNDKEFLGTPFQADVLARLNEFDRMWKPLVLLDPPPPPEPAPTSQEEEAEDESRPSSSAPPQATDSDQPQIVPEESAPETASQQEQSSESDEP